MKKILFSLLCLIVSNVVMAQSKVTQRETHNLRPDVHSKTHKRTFHIRVINDNDFDKFSEPIAVSLKIEKPVYLHYFPALSAMVTEQSKPVQCQLDDIDGDYLNDELFFVTDIKAHEKKEFEVTLVDSVIPIEETNRIYSALQFRDKKDRFPDLMSVEAKGNENLFNDIYMHGMTIESELTGYRIYFDERQNIDLYGKKYRRIELPTTQFYTSAEQLEQGYGVDVLWAGKAIGCGSFKQYKDGKPANWTDVGVRGQRVVTTGPLRTIVEMRDMNLKEYLRHCKFCSDTCFHFYNVLQRYTLVAGHRDLSVDVRLEGNCGKSFCTGVQKVGVTADDSVRCGHKPEGFIHEDGLAASWGCDYPDMGKKQLWTPEAIGMAVYVPTKYVKGQNEDELNYFYIVSPESGELHYNVTFCADKEVNGYHSAAEWFSSLDAWKKNIENPVKIRVLR